MKTPQALEKLKYIDRDLAADIAVALMVTAAFTLFAVTVFQMDSLAGSMMVFPGRTVYM